jgi:hypothetical protein
MPETSDQILAQINAGSNLPPEKRIYFNGYTVASSASDVAFVLMHNNQPVAALTTSFTVAKSLIDSLAGVVKFYEDRTGQHVLTQDEIAASFAKDSE